MNNKAETIKAKVSMINYLISKKNNELSENELRENQIQNFIVKLSSFCSVKIRSEVTLINSIKGSKDNKTRRIDLMLNNEVAVELKRDQINIEAINETIGERGYIDLLKSNFPEFKMLILCAPNGITESAKRLIEALNKEVVYLSVSQLSSIIADIILDETPIEGHWWLHNFLFPQFKGILPTKYYNSVELSE